MLRRRVLDDDFVADGVRLRVLARVPPLLTLELVLLLDLVPFFFGDIYQ